MNVWIHGHVNRLGVEYAEVFKDCREVYGLVNGVDTTFTVNVKLNTYIFLDFV